LKVYNLNVQAKNIIYQFHDKAIFDMIKGKNNSLFKEICRMFSDTVKWQRFETFIQRKTVREKQLYWMMHSLLESLILV